ncbi:unnamed protein product [Leuciscus chuanchicus]
MPVIGGSMLTPHRPVRIGGRDLAEFAELQRKERERITLEKEEQRKTIQAQRLHFLLSTKQNQKEQCGI